MQSTFFLMVIGLTAISFRATAADSGDFVAGLINIATTQDTPLQTRAEAMNTIGKLGAKGLGGKTDFAVKGLTNLLHNLADNPGEAPDFLKFYAIQALGQIGTPARPALPELVAAVGNDLTLNSTICNAVTAITMSDSVATQTSDVSTNAPTVLGYRLDLGNKSSAATRLAAVKGLRDFKQKALPAVADIAGLMTTDSDADVRRLSAEATKDILDTLPNKDTDAKTSDLKTSSDEISDNTAPSNKTAIDKSAISNPAKIEWFGIYINNLKSLLNRVTDVNSEKYDPQERLFATRALAQVAQSPYAFSSAKVVLTDLKGDNDPTVQAAASIGLNQNKQPPQTTGDKSPPNSGESSQPPHKAQ
jgi:hypothetical protein